MGDCRKILVLVKNIERKFWKIEVESLEVLVFVGECECNFRGIMV